MSIEHPNNYLMEIELCLNQQDELKNPMILFLNNIEKHYGHVDYSLDISININSFRVSCKGVVDSDNNIIMNIIFTALKEFKTAFVNAINQGGEVDFSIYIWSSKASDTPQIDFNLERVQLLGDIGANLSFIVYTYDPE